MPNTHNIIREEYIILYYNGLGQNLVFYSLECMKIMVSTRIFEYDFKTVMWNCSESNQRATASNANFRSEF